jgi:hypothetical protein
VNFTQRLVAVSLLAFCATLLPQGQASAKSYKCEAAAIAAKKTYVVGQFQQYVAGKYKGSGALGPVLLKIWDGNGDCDTSGDAPSKLKPETMLNLVMMHYYGDIMTVSAYVAGGKTADARPYIDDYKQVHGLIAGDMKAAFDASFLTQDKELTSAMRDYDAQVAKAGAKSKVADKI